MNDFYFLGVDIGTSVIKAALYNQYGNEYSLTRQKVPVKHPKPLYAEQDMNEVWDVTTKTIRQCLDSSKIVPSHIAAIACTGQGDGLWTVDKQGHSNIPAILWNDNRASEIIHAWLTDGTLKQYFKKSGTVLWPGSTAAILKWLKENCCFEKYNIESFFNAKDWINYKLTDVIATDETDASIPFMDLKTRTIDPEQAAMLGLRDVVKYLPHLIGHATDQLGVVTTAAAQQTGLREGTPVMYGLLDVVSNAVGAGVVHAGQSLIILGTTLLYTVVMDEANFDPFDVGATICGAKTNQWMRVFGSETGTPNFDWLLREFAGLFETEGNADLFKNMENLIHSSSIGANGIIYHPFINGERAPFVNPSATSSFLGIRGNNTISDLVRSVFEGTAMSVKHSIDLLAVEIEQINIVGGGAKNLSWGQILADVTGSKIVAPKGAEFGTKGAAIIAGHGSGILDEMAWIRGESTVEDHDEYIPDKNRSKKYDQIFDLYIDLTRTLAPFWKKRAELLSEWS